MKMVELGSISEIVSGSTPSRRKPEYFGGDINWFTPKDLGKIQSKYVTNSPERITQAGYESCSAKMIPPYSVLFTCRAPIGHIAINREECCTNQGFKSIVPNKSIVDVDFLYHLIKKNVPQIQNLGRGATFKELSKGDFSNFKIPLPPITTQKKIAAILDEADKLCQLDKALIAKYDQLAQSLFLEMFGDPVSNPKGWKKKNMGSQMQIVRGGSPRPIGEFLEGTYPWIKIGDATGGNDIYLESTKQHIIEEGLRKTRLLPKGSLIFANCGVSLGFARIITFEGCIHDGWLAFSEINEQTLNKIFLLKALNSITRYFRETAPDGTQPNLNIGIMSKFEIILPPIELQIRFEKSLFEIETQKAQAQRALAKSEELFNSLGLKAFKGELV